MRRVLFALLVLTALGLGAALGALTTVQAGQLRGWLGPSALALLTNVAPEARVPHGEMQLKSGLAGAPLTLRWSRPHLAQGLRWPPDWTPQWHVTATAAGLRAAGLARPERESVQITLTRADLDLSLFATQAMAIGGTLTLLSGQISADWQGTGQSGTARGLLEGLVLNGQGLGDFSVDLTLRPLQSLAELTSLPDGPVQAQARISVLAGQSTATLELQVDDTDALPPPLRRLLSRIGTPRPEGGWRIDQAVPLP